MKIMVVSPKNKTLFNFRGDLIKEIIERGHEVIATGPNMDYIDDVINLGVRFIEVPFVKDNVGILGDLKYCKQLKEIMLYEQPDLIFSYTIKPVIYSSIAAHNAGVKSVYPMITGLGRVYTGSNVKTKVLRLVTGFLYKKAFNYCSKVIFQNKDDMQLFIENRYLKEHKCEKVDGSGVNMNRFTTSDLPDSPVFLMISRIIREKGIYEFAEAAKYVKDKHPDARFVLLGGYDSSIGAIKPEEIEKYITSGIIEFPGEVKDVAPFLKDASVFVLPTYYREGIPRTILEAMATARPVLTTNWVGCKEAVEHGINGFLVPIQDPIALAEKMIYMIENYDKTRKMGMESLRICKEKFDVDIVNKRMIEIMNL